MPRSILQAGLPLLCAAAALAGPPALAANRDEAGDRAAETVGNCIRVRQILRTEVLDDQSVILTMSGDRTLVMRLKYPCPQLAFHDYFSYEAALGLLCAEIDHIVTRAGAHCQIGGFEVYRPAPSAPEGAGDEPAA